MVRNRVKGITIQIGGDTTGLDKALKDTNKNISNTQSQLRDVERLLKLDPKNTELLAQKQKLLAQATEETKEKLQVLNNANEQLRDSVGTKVSAAQFDSLQREIVETEQALERLEERGKVSLEAISDKAGKVAKTFAPATKAVAALYAATVATVPGTEELREKLSMLDSNAEESAVSVEHARAAWKKFAIQSGDTGSAVEAVSNLLQADFTESNLQRAVEGLAGAAVRFPDTLKVESLADSLQETLATGAATGQFAELLERLGINLDEFNAGLTGAPAEEAASEAASLAEKLGLATDSLISAKEAAEEAYEPNFFESAGLKVDDFSEKMETAIDATDRQNYILQTLADAGLNDSYEAWKKNNEEMLANREASLKLEQSLASIAETILPVVSDVTSAIAVFLDWFADLPGGAQMAIAALFALVGAISPVAGAVSNVMGLLDKLSGTSLPGLGGALGKISGTALPGLSGAFSKVFGFIAAHPIVLLIGAIAGLVAFIAKNGDEVQHGLGNLNTFLKDVFVKDWAEVFGPVLGGLLNNFLDIVEGAWDYLYTTFDGVIDFIRGLFTWDLQRALDGVVKIFKAPINTVISMVNQAIDSLNWLIEGANKIPGVNIGTIGQIPLLANGGEVLQGSAIVGDDGPELLTVLGDRTVVQPLTTNNTYRNTALGGVNVNVYGAPGQDVRELAGLVGEELQRMVESEEAKL